MKKFLKVFWVMILFISCISLTACGEEGGEISPDSPYIGTWTAYRAIFKDEEQPIEEVLDGAEWKLVLNADGTCESISTDAGKGKWWETKKGVKLKGDDLNKEFVSEDGELYVNILGMKIYFEKQE